MWLSEATCNGSDLSFSNDGAMKNRSLVRFLINSYNEIFDAIWNPVRLKTCAGRSKRTLQKLYKAFNRLIVLCLLKGTKISS